MDIKPLLCKYLVTPCKDELQSLHLYVNLITMICHEIIQKQNKRSSDCYVPIGY